MNVGDLQTLYEYDAWANRRILETINTVDEAAFTRDLHSSFPSIQATMSNLVAVEWVWLRRWKGESPAVAPEWAKAPSAAQLTQELEAIEVERDQFLAMLGEDELQRPVSYRNFKGEPLSVSLGDLLLHCANHSTYHSGQL